MRYYVPDLGETIADAREILLDAGGVPAIQAAAEAFHAWRGWECSWPLTFALVSADGTETRWEVDREIRPEFFARQIL